MTPPPSTDTAPESSTVPANAGPAKEKEKKTRSRSGCYTCRRRKKACDHVHPVCGNCLRLEIPCIYQKVTGNKKRKRRAKDGTEQDDDDDPDPDEAEDAATSRDPDILKAKEKPFYSLLEPGPSVQAEQTSRKRHAGAETGVRAGHLAGMESGFALPVPEGQPSFSLGIDHALDDFVHADAQAFQGMPLQALNAGHVDLFPSGPLLDPSKDQIPPDDALAMFSQFYSLNNFEATLDHPSYNPTPRHPPNPWSRRDEILTPSVPPTLDHIFSPIGRTSPETLHSRGTKSPGDQSTVTAHVPDGQETDERYEEVSSATAVRPLSPATSQIVRQFIHSAHATPERPLAASTDPLGVGQMTDALPSWLWAHVPTLLDYFINGFAPVISVLGKPERNKLLKTLLPAASTSPILLHALIGWAASHLAVAQPNRGDGKNEPYTSIARITTSIADHTALVKMNSVGMQGAQEGDLSLENEMWLLLILGGIEVCCGSIAKWNNRLPYIRNLMWRLERSLPASNTHSMSSVHISLALNCIYHDITGSLATTRDPGIPLRVYETFIRGSLAEPDVYMGASATVYQVYAEIAMLAAQISALDAAEATMETQFQLRDLLLNIHSCAGKIDSLDIHPEIVRVVEDSPEDALENHHLILAFHMHKLAARLLLRQTCLRCTPADLESRLLCARLLGAIQPVLHTPSEAQILLPLFLAGVDATSVAQKEQVRQIFKSTRQRTGCENAHAVYGLLKRVWAANHGGRAWVDWRALAEKSEAVISFA